MKKKLKGEDQEHCMNISEHLTAKELGPTFMKKKLKGNSG